MNSPSAYFVFYLRISHYRSPKSVLKLCNEFYPEEFAGHIVAKNRRWMGEGVMTMTAILNCLQQTVFMNY